MYVPMFYLPYTAIVFLVRYLMNQDVRCAAAAAAAVAVLL